MAMLGGALMPDWLSDSLVVFIPKATHDAAGVLHAAAPRGFKPIALSNTCQKLLTKALNSTLEEVARQVVYSSQRGFVRGRRMGDATILMALSAQEKALILGENACGATVFDIATAFPSVAREWVWAAMGDRPPRVGRVHLDQVSRLLLTTC